MRNLCQTEPLPDFVVSRILAKVKDCFSARPKFARIVIVAESDLLQVGNEWREDLWLQISTRSC